MKSYLEFINETKSFNNGVNNNIYLHGNRGKTLNVYADKSIEDYNDELDNYNDELKLENKKLEKFKNKNKDFFDFIKDLSDGKIYQYFANLTNPITRNYNKFDDNGKNEIGLIVTDWHNFCAAYYIYDKFVESIKKLTDKIIECKNKIKILEEVYKIFDISFKLFKHEFEENKNDLTLTYDTEGIFVKLEKFSECEKIVEKIKTLDGIYEKSFIDLIYILSSPYFINKIRTLIGINNTKETLKFDYKEGSNNSKFLGFYIVEASFIY